MNEIDPQLPFIQVHRSVAALAAQLAPLLGITYQHARGGLDVFWESLADRRILAKAIALPAPMVVLTEDEAQRRLEFAFGMQIRPSLMETAGVLEKLPDGAWRVRGMSRYVDAEAVRLNRKAAPTVRPPSDPPSTPQRKEEREEREEKRKEEAACIEALRQRWNDAVPKGIPRVETLGKARSRLALDALARRPLDEWGKVFAKIAASAFCRGASDGGWVATFDWALRPEGKKPETALKVIEGAFDGSPTGVRLGSDPDDDILTRPKLGACALCGGAATHVMAGLGVCYSCGEAAEVEARSQNPAAPWNAHLEAWAAERRAQRGTA